FTPVMKSFRLKAAVRRRTPKRKRKTAFAIPATFWSAAVLCRFRTLRRPKPDAFVTLFGWTKRLAGEALPQFPPGAVKHRLLKWRLTQSPYNSFDVRRSTFLVRCSVFLFPSTLT